MADQRTALRIMRHDGRLAAIAATQRDIPHIEPIAALLLLRPVTAQTALFQNRLNVPGEIRRDGESGLGDDHSAKAYEEHREVATPSRVCRPRIHGLIKTRE